MISEKVSLPISMRRRGVAVSSITHLEKHVIELEAKDKLMHKDLVAIKGFIKRLESLDTDFKLYHCNVIDVVEEDEGILMEEQAKLDDHEDRVTNLMSRLLKLSVEEEKFQIPLPGKPEANKRVIKWLCCIQKNMKSLNTEVESMSEEGEFDKYALQGDGMQVHSLKAELTDVTHEILSLEEGEALLEDRSTLKGSLFKLKIMIEQLLDNQSVGSQSIPQPCIRLPKISVPTFDGTS